MNAQVLAHEVVPAPGAGDWDLVSRAAHWARTCSERPAFTLLRHGESSYDSFTFGALDRASRRVAASLRRRGLIGERVLIVLPAGLDFLRAFFGCLYAGVIAVPVAPVQNAQDVSRFRAISENAGARVVLTCDSMLQAFASTAERLPWMQTCEWLTMDALQDGPAESCPLPPVAPDAPAFLQYTSGSTGSPRGVVVTHRSLASNLDMIRKVAECTPASVGVSWLPHYHDMGLIVGLLAPVFTGYQAVMMSPLSFVKRPFAWLKAITDYRGTISGAPNFAYELCIQRITPEQRAELDLSSWRVAFCGAEPVRASTVSRFIEAFAPCRFPAGSLWPSYGLAENTLLVSTSRNDVPIVRSFDAHELGLGRVREATGGALPGQASPPGSVRELVGCGKAMDGQRIMVVDPEALTECAHDRVGEVWLSGPSVAAGYWNNPHDTAAAFNAYAKTASGDDVGPCLRTGDLGFIHGGELFIAGRLKDVLIVRGRNHHPQDIEHTVERTSPLLRPSGTAVFSADIADEERVIIVQEVKRDCVDSVDDAVLEAISRSVGEGHGLNLYQVVLVKPGGIAKTTSGKVRRRATKLAWLQGELPVVRASKVADGAPGLNPEDSPRSEVEKNLARIWQKVLETPLVGLSSNFFELGGDSLGCMSLSSEIHETFRIDFPIGAIFENPTLAEMSRAIESGDVRSSVPDLNAEVKLAEDVAVSGPPYAHQPYRHVLLTGATGFLGAFLLRELVTRTDAMIHCLVRARSESEGVHRVRDAMARVGLTLDRPERIRIVLGNLGIDRLGLSETVFDRLASEVDAIFHNGALVDWVRPYTKLRSHNVTGTHEALRLACHRKVKPLHYVSTLWVFPVGKKRPIRRITEFDVPSPVGIDTGYNQSKWVAERLVLEARHRGLPVSVHRMDFVAASSETGAQKITDLIPRIIQDAINLGCMPANNTNVDIVPVDVLSRMIVSLAIHPDSIGRVFHLMNTHLLSLDIIHSVLTGMGYTVTRLPWREFKDTIRRSPRAALYPLGQWLELFDEEDLRVNLQEGCRWDQAKRCLTGAAPGLLESMPRIEDFVRAMVRYLIDQRLVDRPRPSMAADRRSAQGSAPVSETP